MSLLVVGSVAFDTIRTPSGQADEILGGAATYFSVSASWFTPVKVVAVVGQDFTERHLRVFGSRAIDTEGLERVPGKTFRWRGEYVGDMNEAHTLETQLNVFATFAPKIPPNYLDTDYVFLANIDPELQLHVREQLPQARLVGCDSMNYWIQGKLPELKKTLAAIDVVTLNEAEARMLSGQQSLKRAARTIREMGPRTVVIKRGEHGVSLFSPTAVFTAPAYLLDEVEDPTGAGDTFAGGFMGHLASSGDLSDANLRRAVVYGSVMASFAVEEFGLTRLLRLTRPVIEARYKEFRDLTNFDA